MRLAWRASIPNLLACWFTKLPNVFLGSMGTMPTSRMIFRTTNLSRGFVNTLPLMQGVQENTFRRTLFFRVPRGKIWPVRWISSASSRLIKNPVMRCANRALFCFWSAAFPCPHGFRICLTKGRSQSESDSSKRIALTTGDLMVKAPNSLGSRIYRICFKILNQNRPHAFIMDITGKIATHHPTADAGPCLLWQRRVIRGHEHRIEKSLVESWICM